MARKKRVHLSGVTQIIVQTAQDQTYALKDNGDHQYFRQCLEGASLRTGALVHAYSLTASKVSLLITPTRSKGVSLLMQSLGRRYVEYFSDKYQGQTVPWQPRYVACPVEPGPTVLGCYTYIENLPVTDGFCPCESLYPWSSYHANVTGNLPRWMTVHAEIEKLGATPALRAATYLAQFDQRLRRTGAAVDRAVRGNRVFGSQRFIENLEALCRFRLTPGKPGRPRKHQPALT